jgi:hypothetical protein
MLSERGNWASLSISRIVDSTQSSAQDSLVQAIKLESASQQHIAAKGGGRGKEGFSLVGLVMLPVLVSKHLHVLGYNVRVLIKGYTDEVSHAGSDL